MEEKEQEDRNAKRSNSHAKLSLKKEEMQTRTQKQMERLAVTAGLDQQVRAKRVTGLKSAQKELEFDMEVNSKNLLEMKSIE